jgi:hypothetical protein
LVAGDYRPSGADRPAQKSEPRDGSCQEQQLVNPLLAQFNTELLGTEEELMPRFTGFASLPTPAGRETTSQGRQMLTPELSLAHPCIHGFDAPILQLPAQFGVTLAFTLLKRWPRTSAALGFGAAGTALSLLWWSPVIFRSRHALPFVLFIIVPGVSAAIAGFVFGKPLLDWHPSHGARIAALRGAAIASAALLFFAPLFATVYIWTSPPNEHWDLLGLTLMLLVGSAVSLWWLATIVGALVGWTLFRLASLDSARPR